MCCILYKTRKTKRSFEVEYNLQLVIVIYVRKTNKMHNFS